jgi:hypothetical protein
MSRDRHGRSSASKDLRGTTQTSPGRRTAKSSHRRGKGGKGCNEDDGHTTAPLAWPQTAARRRIRPEGRCREVPSLNLDMGWMALTHQQGPPCTSTNPARRRPSCWVEGARAAGMGARRRPANKHGSRRGVVAVNRRGFSADGRTPRRRPPPACRGCCHSPDWAHPQERDPWSRARIGSWEGVGERHGPKTRTSPPRRHHPGARHGFAGQPSGGGDAGAGGGGPPGGAARQLHYFRISAGSEERTYVVG